MINLNSEDSTMISESNMSSDDNPSTTNTEEETATVEPLISLIQQLEDYTPTIPDPVMATYMQQAGFESSDLRISRVIALAAQKFISDIANDALQQCKLRSSNQVNKGKPKDRRYNLTVEDLTPALSEYGISVKKPPYFV